MMKKQDIFEVVEKKDVGANCFLLVLKGKQTLEQIMPMSFVEVLIENVPQRILRTPISIHDVDYQANTISLVIQKVGLSTKKLFEIKVEDKLSIIYPLGNGFWQEKKKVLLVGGGVGAAPLYYLAKKYNAMGIRPTIVIGARSKGQLFLIDKYQQLGSLHISTEDASQGEKGLVTQNSTFANDYDLVVCCGPTPMMKAVATYFEQRDIPCFVSLENRMACGIGACLCCVTPTKEEGNVCVCTKGPIFLSKDLAW